MIAVTACSGSRAVDAYIVVTDAQLTAGDPIPEPEGEAILTVRGRVNNLNHSDAILMDRATIEKIGLVDYTVVDPFRNVDVTYRGVLMRDLLALWDVADGATTLEMLALNDYRVEVPIDLLRDFPVVLALYSDGRVMTVDQFGPSMLVFPYGEYEFERPLTDGYWIWQLSSITVK